MTPPPPPPQPPVSGAEGAPSLGPRDHPKGVTILVLGILSLVCCGILGPIAWVMGNNAMSEINASPGAYSNRSTVNAGRICGIIGTVLLIVGVAVWLIAAAVGGFTFTTN